MRNRAAGVALVAFVGAAAVAAGTDPVPYLLPGEKVQANLSPAGETKTVGFAGVEGSVLSISAKAMKGSRVTPTLSLLDPAGDPIDVSKANPKGTGRAKAGGIALGATGVFRIGVSTPPSQGGAFELSVSAKVPTKGAWKATLTAGSHDDHLIAAAPGGAITVAVATSKSSRFDPIVELLAPTGASVAVITGVSGKATLTAALSEPGRYTVRVSGGVGAFAARATVKPAAKRSVTYAQVEARPDVRGFSPASVPNDGVVTLNLDGVAFSTLQQVSVVDGISTKASGPIRSIAGKTAAVDIDLGGVPPGTYSLRVTTPGGNATAAADPIEVTNRPPAVLSMSPVEAYGVHPFDMDIRGVGFDATAGVTLRRTSDQLLLPSAVTLREGHGRLTVQVTAPAWTTGLFDVEVRDPNGASAVRSFDLLGYSAQPVSIHTYSDPQARSEFYPRDSAYDATHDRVLLSITQKSSAIFLLYDPATKSVVDTLVLPDGTQGLQIGSVVTNPRVAWDAVSGTFAIGMSVGGNAVLRIVSDTDLHDARRHVVLTSSSKTRLAQAMPAARRDIGGYMVTWDEYTTGLGARLRSQVVTPQLDVDTATQQTFSDFAQGNAAEPVLAYQGNGEFAVAWISIASTDGQFAIRACLLDAEGRMVTGSGPLVTATNAAWTAIYYPEIASGPSDGSAMLGFTYLQAGVLHPGVQRIEAGTGQASPLASLDAGGQLPEGWVDTIRWNPERSEYVATTTLRLTDRLVAIRRIGVDGLLHASPVLERYEGIWGILYSGPKPGQLGLARMIDGVDDEQFEPTATTVKVSVGPIR